MSIHRQFQPNIDPDVERPSTLHPGTLLGPHSNDDSLEKHRLRLSNRPLKKHTRARQVSVLVDGIHIFQAACALNIDIDCQKLLSVLVGGNMLQGAYFYTGFYRKSKKQVRFIDSLRGFGYSVLTRDLSTKFVQKHAVDFSAEIVTGMIAQAACADTIILVSSDERLARARKYLQKQQTELHLVSLASVTSDRLMMSADRHHDLAELSAAVQRSPAATTSPIAIPKSQRSKSQKAVSQAAREKQAP